MLFDGWDELWRILVVGVGAYAGLVAILRATGKRTLSKMNAFDLIVTVALGSTLATVFLNRDVALVEGLFALALLCLLQYAVAFISVRSGRFQSLVKADPSLLAFRGRFLAGPMRRERVTEEEVYAALRAEGVGDLSKVAAVVLETDGSISVVPEAEGGPDTLANVKGASPG